MATDFDAAARTWDSPEKVDRSARIAEAIADAVPLDPAWSALDYGCGTGQLTWHLGDRIHHPVDLAYSAMALHHIPDTAAVLGNLTASLHPGGWVALADLDADPANTFHADDFDGHRGIDRHALAASLRELGYLDVAERTALRVTKAKHGTDHTHDIFLVTGRRPG